jgi:anthranilate synthase component II
MKVLMLDNYDSFTYNLVQYLGELGAQVETIRNDEITADEILSRPAATKPDRIVISPGPCSPNEAGISVELIQKAAGKIPLLGVCLGHQAIGAAFGGEVVRAKTLMHGKTSQIEHTGQGVFRNLPSPMTVTRYHSLAVRRETLPSDLVVTSWAQDGEIMGMQHRTLPVHGVQFHPESILSEHGHAMLKNFLEHPEVL